MYNDGSGSVAEIWFTLRIEALRMRDPNPPSLVQVRFVLMRHLSERLHRALKHINDETDVSELLDLAFKTDILLRVQNMQGESQGIAVDVTTDRPKAKAKLKTINSPQFAAARKELGVDCHWIVVVNVNALPSKEELMDAIYEQVDKGKRIVILEL